MGSNRPARGRPFGVDQTHRIEIDVYPGTPPLEFDVNVAPGQTVTYHARY